MTDKEALEIIKIEKLKHEDDNILEIAYTHAIDALIDAVKNDKQFNEAMNDFKAVNESEVIK